MAVLMVEQSRWVSIFVGRMGVPGPEIEPLPEPVPELALVLVLLVLLVPGEPFGTGSEHIEQRQHQERDHSIAHTFPHNPARAEEEQEWDERSRHLASCSDRLDLTCRRGLNGDGAGTRCIPHWGSS